MRWLPTALVPPFATSHRFLKSLISRSSGLVLRPLSLVASFTGKFGFTAVAEQRYDAPRSAIEDDLLEGEAFCIWYAM